MKIVDVPMSILTLLSMADAGATAGAWGHPRTFSTRSRPCRPSTQPCCPMPSGPG